MKIERSNLRSQIRTELLRRMRTGSVRPGEGINEVELASDLGVSRTPLREALISLEGEGHIGSVRGKGFKFLPFSRREFEELAPILAALEGLALQLTPIDDLRALGKPLTELAAAFTLELAKHSLVISKDNEWHGLMLSACPNERLLSLTESVRTAFHRYESLLVSHEAMVARVAAEHTTIARCIADGDVPGAIEALRLNWLHASERILKNASSTYLVD